MRSRTILIALLLGISCGSRQAAPPPLVPDKPADAPPPMTDFATVPATPTSEWPIARREQIVDVVQGVSITDPYRWLEKLDNPGVKEWMDAEDQLARGKLAALPVRAALASRFKELIYIDSVSAPYHEGKRFFYSRSHADKEKSIVYYRDGDKGAEQVLFDPNTMSEDGSISLGGYEPAQGGRYVAYRLRKNGADAATMYVRDLETGKDLEKDIIEGARYANASWTPDAKGFYYTWLPTDPAIPVDELPGKAEVRFHALGTDPKTDRIVHDATNDPQQFVGADLSRDGRWLLYYVQHGWNSTDIFIRDLQDKKQIDFKPVVTGVDANFLVNVWKGKLYIQTNDGAPMEKVYKVDPKKLDRKDWKEIVPERADAKLEYSQIVGGKLVLAYLHNASSEVKIVDLEGKAVRDVALPGIGSASGMVGRPDEDEAYFSYASFVQTPQIFKTSIKTGKTTLWEAVKIPADTSQMTAEQVWYPSKDGTKISMFLIHRKDLQKTGDTPVMLTGYGGFNVSESPWFSSGMVVWLEHGGLVAVPNLRGGGEYGESWHRAGMLAKKQNVFDDFIGAAEYLIAEKYTSADKIAIKGASNGGLLVGAAMVQRPDLFKAVVCGVPLLDMVRYHLFGSGRTWVPEYGSADDPELFKAIYAYSPYHHIKDGTAYPSLLMTSADSDDRVDPMHARKFVAAIQHASSAKRPIWLTIEKNAGHGGADLRRQTVEDAADAYAFMLSELGAK